MPTPTTVRSSGDPFGATRWTMVLAAAGGGDSTSARTAIEELCRIYWKPVHAYVLRRGHAAHEAEDLTQEFFLRLLAKNWLESVDRAKGRFRAFLLASLKHFLANEWDREQTLKRGGGREHVPFDALNEPVDHLSPDKAFDRQWALTVLDQVLARLRAEYRLNGKENLFDEFKEFLAGGEESYAAVAARCGLSEGAVKVSVHRLRRRYRKMLREEVAQTVAEPEQVDPEIRRLFAAFR